MFSWIRHYVTEVCTLPSALLVEKGIGPDMFLWIGHYVAEVCALPSALLVYICVCPHPESSGL